MSDAGLVVSGRSTYTHHHPHSACRSHSRIIDHWLKLRKAGTAHIDAGVCVTQSHSALISLQIVVALCMLFGPAVDTNDA